MIPLNYWTYFKFISFHILFDYLYRNGTIFIPDVYSMFTFEVLHNFHLGISKLVKNYFISYLSSEPMMSNLAWMKDLKEATIKLYILHDFNYILSSIQSRFGMKGKNILLEKREASSALVGFLRTIHWDIYYIVSNTYQWVHCSILLFLLRTAAWAVWKLTEKQHYIPSIFISRTSLSFTWTLWRRQEKTKTISKI